ncbi:MAG TPA: 16S rRNA (cytidine(1402)-2'-O)-methyltransferase [Paracoccaceae bacterium]|nr:16S rRNA (cytidine(1402)-2'-O)-methyltransferase [Paracoccaceae bacterium]
MSGTTPAIGPGLYLVATPIGTASDITLRALDILRHADVLAAEDTRNTRRLLDIHGVHLNGRPLLPYHDHNGAQMRPKLLAAIADGKSVAYVSDAGTPLIADPGYRLAEGAIEAGLPVTAAPGASAVLAALSVAGLPTDRFLFVGFAPVKEQAKKSFYEEFARVPATLVFYESPRRTADSLKTMLEVFGDRRAAVCRELTKRFEEVQRDTLSALAARYAEADPKGEVVIVVAPPLEVAATEADLDHALQVALGENTVKDAAKLVAQALDLPRKQVYARALELSGK